jgi:hypothetical protein
METECVSETSEVFKQSGREEFTQFCHRESLKTCQLGCLTVAATSSSQRRSEEGYGFIKEHTNCGDNGRASHVIYYKHKNSYDYFNVGPFTKCNSNLYSILGEQAYIGHRLCYHYEFQSKRLYQRMHVHPSLVEKF